MKPSPWIWWFKVCERVTDRKIQKPRNKERRQKLEEHLHLGSRQMNKKTKEFCQVTQNRLNTCSVCQKFKFLTIVEINTSIYLPTWFLLQDCKYLIKVTHNIHLLWLLFTLEWQHTWHLLKHLGRYTFCYNRCQIR